MAAGPAPGHWREEASEEKVLTALHPAQSSLAGDKTVLMRGRKVHASTESAKKGFRSQDAPNTETAES